jgi:hypothetical protein
VLVGVAIVLFFGQVYYLSPYLNDDVRNAFSPSSSDADDYVDRARLIARGEENRAFKDGYRMPGYPLLLAFFLRVSTKPLQAVRYFQVAMAALIIVPMYLGLRRMVGSHRHVLWGAVVGSLWPSFYYFGPILMPEAMSLVTVAWLIALLLGLEEENYRSVMAAVALLVATLVYLKPNHLLVVGPILIFAWWRLPTRKWLIAATIGTGVFVASIAPWSMYVTRVRNTPMVLTTAQGTNLLLGTGHFSGWEESLPGRVRRALGLWERDLDLGSTEAWADLLENDRYYRAEAWQIWKRDPVRTSMYGMAKVLHSFGFSLRGVGDLGFVVQLVCSLSGAGVLAVRRTGGGAHVVFLGILGIVALQAFVFLANQRFKVVLFDFPATLVMVGAGLVELIRRRHGVAGRCA